MTFSFYGSAHVEHVNLRKEGAADIKHLACDVKLSTITSSDVLIPFSPTLRDLLFTDSGSPRVPNMKPLGLEGSVRHLRCRLPAWKLELLDVEAKKFTFLPIEGHRVEMVFSLGLEPQSNETARLAEILGETVLIEIGVEADLLSEEPAAAKVTAEAKRAAREFQKLADRDGATMTFMDGKGKPLATIAPKKRAATRPSKAEKAAAEQVIAWPYPGEPTLRK